MRFFFSVLTLFLGIFLQSIGTRYLSLFDAAPQLLLLFVVAHGFIFGPVMAVLLGFGWGLISDSMGVALFGMNAFLLSMIGYLAGTLRRRVASERLTAQLVIALAATSLYALGAMALNDIFEGNTGRVGLLSFLVEAVYNVLLIGGVFAVTERWADIWRIEREPV